MLNSLSFPNIDDELLVEVIKCLRRYRYNLEAISEQDEGIEVLFYFNDEAQVESFLNEFKTISESNP